MRKKLSVMYFSPTGTTEKIVSRVSREILKRYNGKVSTNVIDFTLPGIREERVSFTEEDAVVIGVPVYAGRVPNILLKYLNTIEGNGALAVVVVVYGNRNFDDAAVELQDILEGNGFKVVAAGAFIGEHSFSKVLGKDRPDKEDMRIAREFANQVYEKINTGKVFESVAIKGNRPYRKYYMPKNEEGVPVDIRKVTPKTNDSCIDCKLCAEICPMGSIDYDDVAKLNGICIKCGACIKRCPAGAKYFDDGDYLRHKRELEVECAVRREPELFL